MNDPVAVTLIEDDVATLQYFAGSLREDDRFRVLATCQTCAEARLALDAATPEVLVTDLRLPDGDGFDMIEHVRCETPDTEIMVISALGDERSVVRAIRLGASGYLLKDASPFDIRELIKDLMAGRSPISISVARHIVKSLQPGTSSDLEVPTPVSLTERELDILWGIAKGFTYKDVARQLGMSPQTVPTHIKNIYRKLDVNSRSEAVFEAIQSGLIALT